MWHVHFASKLFLLAFVVACAAATSPPRFRAALGDTPQDTWAKKLATGGELHGKSQPDICGKDQDGKDTTIHFGANKGCCKVAEGVGFCLNKVYDAPIKVVGVALKQDSIDREIANVNAVKVYIEGIAHLRVLVLSKKVFAPCTTGPPRKKCAGYFNEWADGTFVHPVRDGDWGSGGELCTAAKITSGKAALAMAFGKLAKKLNEGEKQIIDFQGAVLKDGTFLFADVGKIRDDIGARQAKKIATACLALGKEEKPAFTKKQCPSS